MTPTQFHLWSTPRLGFNNDMDVPYNKSGASSRAHYQIVRNVESAPHKTEHLVRHEVDRIRQRIAGKLLSTSELRKDLIVLLYCLNSSSGSVNSNALAFALPSAVHLAEAGSRTGEKRIGYLFCWEVMSREHELQLMLVNTIRKDLTSSSVARISLALESLINLPSVDVIPAVHTRCVELLSYPSARVRALAMRALQSLAQFSPELLHDKNIEGLVLKRLEDGDEGVVRTALSLCLSLVESRILESERIMRLSISLLSRLSGKHSEKNHSPSFTMYVLGIISKLYEGEDVKAKLDQAAELLPPILTIFRRAVRHNQRALTLECFRLLGRFPVSVIAQYFSRMSATSAVESHTQEESLERHHASFIHPVARIRHLLSSQIINDYYLFLSCLVCLDPSLWAGTSQQREQTLALLDGTATASERNEEKTEEKSDAMAIPPVLDQLEVERVLSFLESDDEQIRGLTLRILISLDPSLVDACYSRAVEAVKVSVSSSSANGNERARINALLQRSVELASTSSLGNERLDVDSRCRLFVEKVREVVEATGAIDKVNGAIVESVLARVRRENSSTQHSCILCLTSLLHTDQGADQSTAEPNAMNATLFLILLALTCELASIFTSEKSEIVSMICMFTTKLHAAPGSTQELILLCMTRLVALLSSTELSSLEMEDVVRVIHEFGEASLLDKSGTAVFQRCKQFEKSMANLDGLQQLLGSKQNVSLPELAFLLDQADRNLSQSVSSSPKNSSKTLSPSPSINSTRSPTLSQSKLRYDAYAPPPVVVSSIRLLRAHSHSSVASASSRTSNRPSSRASSSRQSFRDGDVEEVDPDAEMSRTVTAGELTLAASKGEYGKRDRSEISMKGKEREVEWATRAVGIKPNDIDVSRKAKTPSDLLSVDSPFLPEPLVDVNVGIEANIAAVAPAVVTSGTPPQASSPYVSASSSLRTSPEPGQNFKEVWSELGSSDGAFSARGWCEDAVDVVVRKLQGLEMRMDVLDVDVLPFQGDLKISVHSSATLDSRPPNAVALLRLHEEEDGSCLWQVRSREGELGVKVKELLR